MRSVFVKNSNSVHLWYQGVAKFRLQTVFGEIGTDPYIVTSSSSLFFRLLLKGKKANRPRTCILYIEN